MPSDATRLNGGSAATAPERPRDSTRRVITLAVSLWLTAIAASAILAHVQQWPGTTRWPSGAAFAGLALGFAATEIFVVHVHFAGDAHSFSLVELPLALGLFFAPPAVVIAAQFLGAGAALIGYRRQNWLKILFNTGQFFFATVAVIGLYRALPHHGNTFGAGRFLEGAVALGLGSVVTATLVFSVISTLTNTWRARTLITGLRIAATTATLTISLGVISAIVVEAQPALVWLIAVPTGGIYLANWAFSAQHRRHEAMTFLYEFTAGLTGSTDLNSTLTNVTTQSAKVLRAADAGVYLATGPGVYVSSTTNRNATPDLDDALWQRVLQGGQPVCLARGSSDLDSYLTDAQVKDLIAAPLTHANATIGAIVVRNRLGEASTFDADDLALLATIAGQTTVTLENLRLLDRLRDETAERAHQALHDELTGLPNRAHLYNELDQQLPNRAIAIAIVDLDRFQDVNDTLGHAAGDTVLTVTAERLRANLPSSALIARLGGDEFAVILYDINNPLDAVTKLNTLEVVLTQPIPLDTLSVRIDASIGIATCPDDGTDRATLLRHADVAMYAAKQVRGTAIRRYDRSQERTSKRTLQLVGDLRAAIENNRIDVVFQPKARFTDRQIVGTEALARWDHPTFGPIGPDEFVPLAERAGFIDALTANVLRQSLTVCASLHRSGQPIGVAVNVDAHTLISPGFSELVIAGLDACDLPHDALTLEITERDLVRELDAATNVIHGLRASGVKFSIDDFGTGYSSLSYLARLPVDEVKIDRSFLNNLSESPLNNAIIHAITDIACAMGATTVVEGIEDEGTWNRLAMIGCTNAQGYYLARPMPAEQLLAFVAQQPPTPSTPTLLAAERTTA